MSTEPQQVICDDGWWPHPETDTCRNSCVVKTYGNPPAPKSATIDLQEWANAHVPGDDMLWKNGYWDQICFVRDELGWLFRTMGDRAPVTVVSSHTSKSIVLPVYEIKAHGMTIRMRYNFYNWIVSVEVDESRSWGVTDKFRDLFDREAVVSPIYAEGFKNEWVHGPYAESRRNFTVALNSRYEVHTFCWLLRAP